jgi:putative hydrolase of the HAD superfamily
MPHFDLIAFDADDTLWHNERLYVAMQTRFAQLLAHYHDPEWVNERLYQTESRNIAHFGYGVKSFALSMIETSIELTEGRIAGSDIQKIIEMAREMLASEVELLPGVRETLSALAQHYPLMLITKGDLLDQETKLARSGLAAFFRHIEVVSHKTRASYSELLGRYGIAPQRFLMVGNSLKSDILPILELDGSAVLIPFEITWLHEAADEPASDHPGYHRLTGMDALPGLLADLETRA